MVLTESYQEVLRKKVYHEFEELQFDLDEWLRVCNDECTHPGKRCEGKTPSYTFAEGMNRVMEKALNF